MVGEHWRQHTGLDAYIVRRGIRIHVDAGISGPTAEQCM